MKKIISAIKGLFDIISIIFDLITDFLSNLIMLFKYLAQALKIALDFISSFPPWLQTFAIITISVVIMYQILGRKSGAD